MNETTGDKKPAAPSSPRDQLTRIPVKHLYFAESIDLPGSSQISNLEIKPPAGDNQRFYACDFIPAWQQFEVTFDPGHKAAVDVQLIPACHIRRWRRA